MATAVTPPLRALRATSHSPIALWHLLSLDAPTVAAAWTVFLAHSFGVAVAPGAPWALAIAVWLLYVGDRIRDAALCDALEERHQFHFKHRAVLIGACIAAGLPLCVLIGHLPVALRNGWLLLAIPLAVYVVSVHGLPLRVPKEPLVAIFFAVATAIPVVASHRVPLPRIASADLAFGAVCWLNCIAIARWEHAPEHAMDLVTAWLARHFSFAASAVVVVAGFPLLQGVGHAGVAISIAAMLSAAVLLMLDRMRPRLQRTTLRALADAALLTPLAVGPLLAALKLG